MVARARTPASAQRGASMIEVLVTIVIIAFGLLGMAGLQSRMQVSEMEAYQRAQALVLLNDIASRITTNRANAVSYVTTDPLGAGMTCPAASVGDTLQQVDSREWCDALQGVSEQISGSRLGAMIGGRGCVSDLGSNEYMITVAWQGIVPLSAPASTVTCGKDEYNTTSSVCVNDLCRRVVTTVVRIGSLM